MLRLGGKLLAGVAGGLLLAVAPVLGGLAASGAVGILPPNNPPANITPVSNDYLTSINSARAAEGVGPLGISESTFTSMPIDEQLFIVVNLERMDRGLPPAQYLTAQLNDEALAGANASSDPNIPTTLSGGGSMTYGGAIWAGGLTSVLEADYFWMYDDGYAGLLGTTSNIACGPLSPSGCWGHRDVILHGFPNCGAAPATLSMGAAFSSNGYPGGSMAAELVSTCGGEPTDTVMTWAQVVGSAGAAGTVALTPTADGSGYWETQANGQVAAFGDAHDYGSVTGGPLNSPIVGMTSTPDGKGYWLVASDGGIFTFGDAAFFGSTGAIQLNRPIVGMSATRDGKGYWLVASDGGIFSFGDAQFEGSMGAIRLNKPVVGMATDPTTGGYWLVASDGGVFSFNAPFFGSTGALHLNRPIVGIEPLTNGMGYRFVASDGGVFCFGQAVFDGSMGGQSLVAPVVSMAPDNATSGYWLAAQDGGIFGFGGANFLGRIISTVTASL